MNEREQLLADIKHMEVIYNDPQHQHLLGVLQRARAMLDASEQLCEIYFNIAASRIGADAVRKERDAYINKIKPPTEEYQEPEYQEPCEHCGEIVPIGCEHDCGD